MNYKEAKEAALKVNKNLDSCREFEKAYHFYKKDSDDDGGFGVVVIKETGKVLGWTSFILNYHPEKNPKEIEF